MGGVNYDKIDSTGESANAEKHELVNSNKAIGKMKFDITGQHRMVKLLKSVDCFRILSLERTLVTKILPNLSV